MDDRTREDSQEPAIPWQEVANAWRVLLYAARQLRDKASNVEDPVEEKGNSK